MKTAAAWIGLLGCLALGCAHVVPPGPVVPPPPDPNATCVTACQNARSMGCPKVGPLCVQACQNVEDSGVFSYPLACLTSAHTCAEWDACQD